MPYCYEMSEILAFHNNNAWLDWEPLPELQTARRAKTTEGSQSWRGHWLRANHRTIPAVFGMI